MIGGLHRRIVAVLGRVVGPSVRVAQFDRASCVVGKQVVVYEPCNIYGCRIGDDVRIGPFVEIQAGVVIGSRVKIGSHSFICAGVTIGDDVFIGHGVMFCNDRYPRGSIPGQRLREAGEWTMERVVLEQGVSIGSGAVILPGLRLGHGSMIGAGAVVVRSVLPYTVVRGDPAFAARALDRPHQFPPQADGETRGAQ